MLSSKGFWFWFRRTWPPVTTLLLLMLAVGLLLWLRNDPAFGSISTLMGVLIGGMTTAFVQIATQTREQVMRREETELQRQNELWDARASAVSNMLEEVASYTLATLDDVFSEAAMREADPKRFDPTSLPKKLEKRYAATGRLTDIRGRATVRTFASPGLNARLQEFDDAYNRAFNEAFNVVHTSSEIGQIIDRTKSDLFGAMAAVYMEIERIRVHALGR